MIIRSNHKRLDEILFENKNIEFGAFFIRSQKKIFIAIGFLSAFSIVLAVAAYPKVKEWFEKEPEKYLDEMIPVHVINFNELAPPPSIEKPIQQSSAEMISSSAKFTEPVVKKDELVKDEAPPTQSELKSVNPGTQNVKGNDSLFYSGNLIPVLHEEKPEPIKTEAPKPKLPEKEEVFIMVEKMPVFPGGDIEMLRFLSKNIRYPKQAIQMGIEGRVFIQFTVGKDGCIKDVKIVKGIGGGCEEEALRVVNLMPAWEPGMMNDKAVAVKFVIPVNFKFSEKERMSN
ncbi:MAG: TonB family protein [Cytophagales bacterium]